MSGMGTAGSYFDGTSTVAGRAPPTTTSAEIRPQNAIRNNDAAMTLILRASPIQDPPK